MGKQSEPDVCLQSIKALDYVNCLVNVGLRQSNVALSNVLNNVLSNVLNNVDVATLLSRCARLCHLGNGYRRH